jgi:hypothetical protein
MSALQDLTVDIKKLSDNARIVKRAHFIAAERKKVTHNIVGVTLIIINILITSNLVESFFTENASVVVIKVLAFIAAVLAGIQTFFNFQKNVESHLSAGRIYATLQQKVNNLLTSTKKSTASEDEIWKEYQKLFEEYLQANTDFEAFVPSNSDYNKARAEIKKQGAANE